MRLRLGDIFLLLLRLLLPVLSLVPLSKLAEPVGWSELKWEDGRETEFLA